MARRGGKLKVQVVGMSDLTKIPGWLEHGQRRFVTRSGKRLAAAIADSAPGGAHGSIGRSSHSDVISATKVAVIVDHPGAKALEEGATIKPKGQALKLRDGRFIHRSRRRRVGSAGAPPGGVFIPPRRYARRALRKRNKIVSAEFDRTMGDLRDGGGL